MLLLPKELIAEYATRPENDVYFMAYATGAMHSNYTLFHADSLGKTYTVRGITKMEMAQKLQSKMGTISEELDPATEEQLNPPNRI